MKKIIFFIILFFSIYVFFITHDYRSITQVTFVNSVGVEYNSDTSLFEVYFFILNNYTFAQTGNSASFTNTHAYTATESDKTILGAENKIRNNSNTKFDLSHVRSFIINENFFYNNNALLLLDYFTNNYKYNPSFEIYITSDSLKDLYKIEHFSEVSGYYTILVNTQNNIPVKHVTFSDFCADLLIPNYTTLYQKIKLKKGVLTDSKEEYVSLNFDGCAFINENLQLISFKYQNLHGIGYFASTQNRPIVIDQLNFQPSKFKITSSVKNNKLLIYIIVNGSFLNNQKMLSNNELSNKLKIKLMNDILLMNDTFINYDIDYFNIEYKYKGKYNYKNLEIDFKFNITLL